MNRKQTLEWLKIKRLEREWLQCGVSDQLKIHSKWNRLKIALFRN